MNTYQYDLVKKLSFIRYGGTEDELRAADILLQEIRDSGGEGQTEEFSVPAGICRTCSVRITSPYERELEVSPWSLSGSFPAGGVERKLFYAEDCSEAALYGREDLSDTAVLVNSMSLDSYKALCERKAAAILVITGKWFDTGETSDLLKKRLSPTYSAHGKIPTFSVWARDALEMVRQGVQTVHLELEQEERENTSRNVVATVVGRELPGESVVITAHYDSVTVGTGSWDNATGTATAMYIYRYFLKNPPRRTLRFVWCGSEEQGLCGSKAYAEAHPDLIGKEIKFCFNFDMCGTVLGVNKVCVTGGDDLKHYAQAYCREYGINAYIYQDVRSTDSAVMADHGIPALDLIRAGSATDIHTRYDLIDTLSAEQLKKDGDFAVAWIDRVANGARLPVGTGMPETVKDKLDRYFHRQK